MNNHRIIHVLLCVVLVLALGEAYLLYSHATAPAAGPATPADNPALAVLTKGIGGAVAYDFGTTTAASSQSLTIQTKDGPKTFSLNTQTLMGDTDHLLTQEEFQQKVAESNAQNRILIQDPVKNKAALEGSPSPVPFKTAPLDTSLLTAGKPVTVTSLDSAALVVIFVLPTKKQ